MSSYIWDLWNLLLHTEAADLIDHWNGLLKTHVMELAGNNYAQSCNTTS